MGDHSRPKGQPRLCKVEVRAIKTWRLCTAERRWRVLRALREGLQRSVRQAGAWPIRANQTKTATLNSMCCLSSRLCSNSDKQLTLFFAPFLVLTHSVGSSSQFLQQVLMGSSTKITF